MLRTVAGALRAARFAILALVAVSALAGVASAHTGKAHHKHLRRVAHKANRDNTAPTAPTNLTARPGDQTVTLHWTASTDNSHVKGYKLYRNNVYGATAAGWSTAYTDGPVPNGQSITYTVKAYDPAGNLSPASNAVTVTPTSSSGSTPPPSGGGSTPPPSGTPVPNGPSGNWALKFDDEFSGTSLDTSKWVCNGYTNNNMSGSTCSDITEGNGEVKLTPDAARQGAQMESKPGDGATNGYLLPVGGVAEARVYMPGDPANCTGGIYDWGGFWVSGDPWPQAGETDVIEILSGHGTINYHSPNVNTNTGAPSGCWANAFHTYTIHRKATSVDVYWDGVLQRSITTQDNGAGEGLILTQGYPGSGGAYGDAAAVRADYVRAWIPA
jgi:hypothetical protein